MSFLDWMIERGPHFYIERIRDKTGKKAHTIAVTKQFTRGPEPIDNGSKQEST
jgi:hypothetical protein